MSKFTASVIIPNYNGIKLLEKNLPSVIKAKKYSKNKIDEIIIVDDASIDGSDKLVKSKFKDVRVVVHKENRGFGEAVNTGARSSRSEFVVLLNSDVKVSEKFLAPCLKHFKDDDVFAVSMNEDGYGWAKGEFKEGFVEHKVGGSKRSHESFWANGGSAAFRRSMWMKLKGMDSLYKPFYWEDIDISYCAQKRGWKVLWEPKAKVTHDHETTMKKYFSDSYRTKIQERNQLVFIWKNITSPILFRKHLRGLFGRLRKHPGYISIVFMALNEIGEIRRKRKVEKNESKVSDEAIFAKFS